MTAGSKCADPVALNLWHPVGAVVERAPGAVNETQLLEEPVSYGVSAGGEVHAWRSVAALPAGSRFAPDDIDEPLPTTNRYGYIWTSLGSPEAELFDLPEFGEPDRHNVWAGSIGVHTSAPRAVENFLDMGHFPYVHSGYLGIEPLTEVKEYDVDLVDGGREIVATRFGYVYDESALAPDNLVASMAWQIGETYRQMVEDIQAGNFQPTYDLLMSDGGFEVQVNPDYSAASVSAEAMDLFETRQQEVVDGTFQVPFIAAAEG